MADMVQIIVDGKPLIEKFKADKLKKKIALRRGLKRAALLLQRESQLIVPVETGNLKRTAETREEISKPGWITFVVSYSTNYALHVHERADLAHGAEFNIKHADRIAKAKGAQRKVWFNRGPRQQWKFLEQPAREHRHRFVDIIVQELQR